MHPPQFRPTHKLSDWPECVIELQCGGGSVGYPVGLLIKRKGDMTFENLVKRLRCQRCGRSNSIRAGRGLGRRARSATGNVSERLETILATGRCRNQP
jgi:hypothetical protein